MSRESDFFQIEEPLLCLYDPDNTTDVQGQILSERCSGITLIAKRRFRFVANSHGIFIIEDIHFISYDYSNSFINECDEKVGQYKYHGIVIKSPILFDLFRVIEMKRLENAYRNLRRTMSDDKELENCFKGATVRIIIDEDGHEKKIGQLIGELVSYPFPLNKPVLDFLSEQHQLLFSKTHNLNNV